MREVLIGFDSAWTDNPRNPGAIAAVIIEDGQPVEFLPPRLARFDAARKLVLELRAAADVLLVAIDQPTIVPNFDSCRPVERVAASIVNRLKGGVQPARRGGGGASMFGDNAPIWRFLDAIDVVQDPAQARDATSGRFAMEVFPALALPSLVPAIWERKRAAKYNPAQPGTFLLTDWQLVCGGLAHQADRLGLPALAAWARTHHPMALPKKADQDRLDAALCLLIARYWRQEPPAAGMVIGDDVNGYIVTPVTVGTRAILESSAVLNRVPVDATWVVAVGENAERKPVPETTSIWPASRVPGSRVPGSPVPGFPVDVADLRTLLIRVARAGRLITYGEVAPSFGQDWHQGFGSSLKKALGLLSKENKARREPQLMCLVVNKTTRQPGDGFYALLDEPEASPERQRALFEQERARCHAWSWPDP